MKNANVIGLMSGTSLDGLDICYVKFEYAGAQWKINQLITKEVSYDLAQKKQLISAFDGDDETLKNADIAFGVFQAEQTNLFIKTHKLEGKVDFVAAHGHTIFHQPANGITLQIGAGKTMANLLQLPVINDFRSLDVKLGGQGAPLVPVGDELLFSEYKACLNLGGFSNISFEQQAKRIAFDIAPCNLPLNRLMHDFFKLDFDENGQKAASGSVIEPLLSALNEIDYYQQAPPKSLGVEWLHEIFYPILYDYSAESQRIYCAPLSNT